MRFLVATLMAAAVGGCASTSLNSSANLEEGEKVVFWLHQDMATQFRVRELNGQKLRQGWLTKVSDAPGRKEMVLEMNYKYKKVFGPLHRVTFNFSFEAKPGHAYNLRLQNGNYMEVSEETKLCLLEERPNAPGSSVNWSNEFRTPSPAASVVMCAAAQIAQIEPS